ncbi:hypothetical protein [Sphingomonas sp.]|uniref:hypothetical protein n=1 Tax=Sphingomonas sp. TaxID=28214 RepID=UPI003B3AFD97
MATKDPARPWHSGPTVLADIRDLAGPAEAPHTIRFSGEMTATFELLRRSSYPGGHSMERGGTIVADEKGVLSLQNIGGHASSSSAFYPSYDLKDPRGYSLVGVFHTHPYDRSELSMNGVSFSGGDIGALSVDPVILAVVQSGPRLFAFVKTALTPKDIDPEAEHAAVNAELEARVRAGKPFQQGSRIIAQQRAERYHLAYYQGANGVLDRV